MSDIKIISYNNIGEITFSIKEKQYTFIVDAKYLHDESNHPFRIWLKYAPGKALNFAKNHGKLINPQPPKFKYEKPENSCPNCGAQGHVEDVICPNCGYTNESFSFKKWFYF